MNETWNYSEEITRLIGMKQDPDFKENLFNFIDKCIVVIDQNRYDNVGLALDMKMGWNESIELLMEYMKSRKGLQGMVNLTFDLREIKDGFTMKDLQIMGEVKYASIIRYQDAKPKIQKK